MRSAALIFFLALLPPASSPAPATISEDQAIAIINKLPEVKAWSAYIVRTTKGKVRSALMVEPEKPVSIAGKRYWEVGFFENQPERYHRWETFLVRVDGKEVLVEGAATGDPMTLKEWRKTKPMDRVRPSKDT